MITVDGKPVEAVGTVLAACRVAGAEVAAFCHDDRLSGGGHCRACLVEVDGAVVAACGVPARDGATVRTDTERLRAYRRDLGELMAAETAPAGLVGRTLAAWGVAGDRYVARAESGAAADTSHPYLRVELGRCILCRLCVRACEEIQGQFVFAIEGRGGAAHLAWANGDFARSGCVACGACVEVCPTGAIWDVDRDRAAATAERVVRTTCGYCGVGCQLDVHVSGDGVARIDGAQAAVNGGHLCLKGRYAHGFARAGDRLTTPLVRRHGRLEPASWDEALARVAQWMRDLRGSVAALSSSRCTNEENYLLQKWLRGGAGSNDIDCCARVCHAPSAYGMQAVLGTGAATNTFADLERADLILVVGANVTESHPVLGARIKQAALRGTRLVVVDPRRTEIAGIADHHLAVRPGANVPLLNALAAVLVEEDLVDRAFVTGRTEGWDEYARFVREHTPERWQEVTGVPAHRVREAARQLGVAARPMVVHGLGVTEHYQGSEAVMLLCNLALLRGAIGRPGTGVNPLRGQNNVQGAADMGCEPDLLPGYAPVADAAVRARFETAWGRRVPVTPGRTLAEMYQDARAGRLRGLYVLGEDVVQSDPDTRHTREALASLEFLVVQEIFLSETAKLAHVVLPGASWLEKDGTFTNGERRIQRVRRALAPPGEARADWEVLSAVMAATGWPQRYSGPDEIMEEIAAVVPDYAGATYDRLGPDGLHWPVPSAGHPGTPVLHVESFPRGRAQLSRIDYLPSPELRDGLILITGRVLEHYNTGSMTRRTPNLALRSADALEIHPRDAAARGISDGDAVVVRSAHGEARVRAHVTERVEPSTLFMSFHFPETGTNAVTGEVRDRMTGCPEYKVTSVEVERA